MPKSKSKSPVVLKLNGFRNQFLGLFLCLLALGVLIIPSLRFNVKTTENGKSPIIINRALLSSKQAQNLPTKIIIPKANIDLLVTPSKIINGYWETSEKTASYGLGSGTPGTKSNAVIFAHAREGLFFNLKNVQAGDTIYVFTKSMWYKYKVNKITAVYPNEIQIIQPTKKETLTLYTCTGFNDEKRLIVIALPSN
jgi:LPXTG-site transpeptidase (sortase) family protein